MNIIKEMYYDNELKEKYSLKNPPKNQEIINQCLNAMRKLLDVLGEENEELFWAYDKAHNRLFDSKAYSEFATGWKLGAAFMRRTMEKKKERF